MTDIEIRAVACGYGPIVGPIIEQLRVLRRQREPSSEQRDRGRGGHERGQPVPLELPVRRGAEPGLRAHGAQVGRPGTRRETRTTLLVGGAIAVALALGGLVGGVLAESRSAARRRPLRWRSQIGRSRERPAASARRRSRRSKQQVRAQPRDAALLTQLGFAYQLRWRETADPSYLPRSEAALRRAVRFGVEDANAILGLGSLALIRHEFRAALEYGRARTSGCCRARRGRTASSATRSSSSAATTRRSPRSSAWSRFVRASPRTRGSRTHASSWAIARGAVAAMRLALDAAAGQPEPTAWAHVELAKLELGLGTHERCASARAQRRCACFPAIRAHASELARIDGRCGTARRCDRAGAPRGRRGPDVAVDRPSRRAARARRPCGRGTPAARDGHRHRPPTRGERRAGRSRVRRRAGGQPRPSRQRLSSSRAVRVPRGRRSTATTRSRGRWLVLVGAPRPFRSPGARCGSALRTGSSTSTSATRRGARETGRRCATRTAARSR